MGKLRQGAKLFIGKVFNGISGICNFFYPDRNANPLIISGSPRSGTTWLAEIIAAQKHARLIWEPLQNGNPVKHHYKFHSRPFIKGNNGEYNRFFEDLLNFKMLNWHTLRLREFPRNFLSIFGKGPLVIKFVRGNGVVNHLYTSYRIAKPVVILRHPCAVISSQLLMGEWRDHPLVSEELLAIYPNIRDVIENASTLEEKLAITWCGDVLAALHNSKNIMLVYYEDLVLNGEEVLNQLFKEWGYGGVPSESLEKLYANSSRTKTWSEMNDDQMAKLKSWENRLTKDQVKNVFYVVNSCGVNLYSSDSYLPLNKEVN